MQPPMPSKNMFQSRQLRIVQRDGWHQAACRGSFGAWAACLHITWTQLGYSYQTACQAAEDPDATGAKDLQVFVSCFQVLRSMVPGTSRCMLEAATLL